MELIMYLMLPNGAYALGAARVFVHARGTGSVLLMFMMTASVRSFLKLAAIFAGNALMSAPV
jgi:hypothetical protein